MTSTRRERRDNNKKKQQQKATGTSSMCSRRKTGVYLGSSGGRRTGSIRTPRRAASHLQPKQRKDSSVIRDAPAFRLCIISLDCDPISCASQGPIGLSYRTSKIQSELTISCRRVAVCQPETMTPTQNGLEHREPSAGSWNMVFCRLFCARISTRPMAAATRRR